MDCTDNKQRAHNLIDQMAPEQVAAAIAAIETLLDPVSHAIANAPWDDEPVSEEERRQIAMDRASFDRDKLISNEEVLAEFGLTTEDFERMARTPAETESHLADQ